MKFRPYQQVRTTRDLDAAGLRKGAEGTILDVYEDGAGYDVDFQSAAVEDGVVSVSCSDIELLPVKEMAGASAP